MLRAKKEPPEVPAFAARDLRLDFLGAAPTLSIAWNLQGAVHHAAPTLFLSSTYDPGMRAE